MQKSSIPKFWWRARLIYIYFLLPWYHGVQACAYKKGGGILRRVVATRSKIKTGEVFQPGFVSLIVDLANLITLPVDAAVIGCPVYQTQGLRTLYPDRTAVGEFVQCNTQLLSEDLTKR